MTEQKITNWQPMNSEFRIKATLNETENDFTERDSIPSADRLTYKDGYYVHGAVMCVDIRDSSTLPAIHTRPVLAKIYRAYLCEMIALVKACSLYRHIKIVGDAVQGVFDVPASGRNINDIFELAAKASSTIALLNLHLEKKGYTKIRVGIGLSFGRLLMVKAGYSGSGYNDIVWMGEALNQASKLGNYGSKEPQNGDREVMVSTSFYNKLLPNYQSLLGWSPYRACYTGDIHDVAIKNFHDNIVSRQAQAAASRRILQAPASPSRAVQFLSQPPKRASEILGYGAPAPTTPATRFFGLGDVLSGRQPEERRTAAQLMVDALLKDPKA